MKMDGSGENRERIGEAYKTGTDGRRIEKRGNGLPTARGSDWPSSKGEKVYRRGTGKRNTKCPMTVLKRQQTRDTPRSLQGEPGGGSTPRQVRSPIKGMVRKLIARSKRLIQIPSGKTSKGNSGLR